MMKSAVRYGTCLTMCMTVFLLGGCESQEAVEQKIEKTLEQNIHTPPEEGVSTEGYGEITDQEIVTQIEQELFLDEAVDQTDIEVQSSFGIVELSGTVPHILARERAVEQAEAVRGVRAVQDRLQVAPASRSDEEIREDIDRTLARDEVIEIDEIEVDVEGAEVELSGEVGSWAERSAAEDLVMRVPGLVDFTNLILVRVGEDERRPEEEILEEVQRRLRMDPYLDSSLVDADVTGSIVHLTGHVGSLSEKRRAVEDARVRGTTFIDTTGLNISEWMNDPLEREKPVPDVEDPEIVETVKLMLAEDPWVADEDVRVSSEFGIVKLQGTTSSLLSRSLAETHARDVLGVWDVENEIRVQPVTATDDAIIKESIRDSFEKSPLLVGEEIVVDVDDGVVTLKGDVDLAFARYMAVDLVSRVPGVTMVKSELTVGRQWSEQEDEAILGSIRTLFRASTMVDEESMEVTVEDGEARITGSAPGWHSIEKAIDLAFMAGARTVKTEVKVKDTMDETTYLWSEWGYHPLP